MADIQTEKAFQKQEAVSLAGKVGRTKGRWYKNVGLGIKTPSEAINGDFVDKKCPFTGNVSVRGTLMRGVVISTKMKRTIVIRRDYLHWVKKYKRFEKRHRNVPAHCSPAFRIREGDQVTIGQCRPLSKTVSFNVLKIDRIAPDADGKKVFTGM
ncbi:40S ribosomal protein S11 [Porphyridium purpureum]|uniref:Small ribosomal subunit protein uS17 n=1 Tax=Porphyridium purpureum TaxID=35688 RepID=A0A5J4YKR3_PORPP|nr:40S ribosomal protein S11 [Porphyridium purpureum]|eukprot:POR0470..scf261_15